MAICTICGEEFDLGSVKRKINRKYGTGVYQSSYDKGEERCYECAMDDIGAGYATGAEIIELMGTSWEDD